MRRTTVQSVVTHVCQGVTYWKHTIVVPKALNDRLVAGKRYWLLHRGRSVCCMSRPVPGAHAIQVVEHVTKKCGYRIYTSTMCVLPARLVAELNIRSGDTAEWSVVDGGQVCFSFSQLKDKKRSL